MGKNKKGGGLKLKGKKENHDSKLKTEIYTKVRKDIEQRCISSQVEMNKDFSKVLNDSMILVIRLQTLEKDKEYFCRDLFDTAGWWQWK